LLSINTQGQDLKNYPNKPVKIVVPFTAGSLVDVLGRAIGEELQSSLKQSFIIENKAGASTLLAAKAVAVAAPDGYTLMVPTVTTLSLGPQLMANPGFDPLKDLTPIARLGVTNFFLVVNPTFPARNMKDWIEVVRKNPGKYSYASSGNGSPQHIFMELLKKQLGLNITHIPYKGSNTSMVDLLSGQVDFNFDNLATAAANIKAGRLKALAVTTGQRSSALPDIPSMSETLKDFEIDTWWGLVAPAATPRDVVERLNKAFVAALQAPETKTRFAQLMAEPVGNTPEQFGAFMKKELTRYESVVKASGAKVD
jgi:tripartite-type tricarboxylate transporter receptor subunit TctC